MAEVNRELAVPFALDPIHCEMWLREERPSDERLEVLIESQPESARPALRRLISEAQAQIGDTADDVEVIVDEEPEPEAISTDLLKDDLIREAEARGLAVSGTKEDLVARIEEHDAAEAKELPTAGSEAEAAAAADAIDAVLEDDDQ